MPESHTIESLEVSPVDESRRIYAERARALRFIPQERTLEPPSLHPAHEFIKQHELPQPPFFIDAIKGADRITSLLMKRAGVSPYSIDASRIHLLSEGAVLKLSHHGIQFEPNGVAGKDPEHGNIFIRKEKHENDIQLCDSIFHEICHVKAYSALEKNFEESEYTSVSRMGLRISLVVKKENLEVVYFIGLDEAVTSLLSKKYLPQLLRSSPHLRTLRRKFPEPSPRLKRLVGEKEDWPADEISWVGKKGERLSVFMYYSQRLALDKIMHCIGTDHPSEFIRTDSVFRNVFEKTYFNGDLSRLAGYIDHSFGEGFFRILGIMTADPNTGRTMNEEIDQARFRVLQSRNNSPHRAA